MMIYKKVDAYQRDWQIFLIFVPISAAINYHLTYSNVQFNWFLVLTFTIDTLQGYIAWLAVRVFIIFLDRKLPYEQNLPKRIALQTICTTILGLVIISLLTELVCWIARGTFVPLDFYIFAIPIIGIWFFVLNGIYIGYYFYNKSQNAVIKLEEENTKKENQTQGFFVQQGKKEIYLVFDEILGYFIEGDYVVICSQNKQRYYLDQSLNKIQKTLPPHLFFRLNRQFIVHRQLITGFKKIENGKIQVLLEEGNDFPVIVTVSRNKAPQFKQWLKEKALPSKTV